LPCHDWDDRSQHIFVLAIRPNSFIKILESVIIQKGFTVLWIGVK
jgi:hypothetical protein